ncbi:tRNA glutamyl-Q(34) synthetase GluQRS [Aestuariibacter halophilus]|uniref:Glutamyl-Q tRNA(Asp) synthetase n=1 Tax=Fluctibacter halophilus TaxID=226011 RepID=A0ABS8GAG0_9ALTE|nr:tRNA glutamyl-Q(34) synthetase GluQRS [Aestuariibacter halophilus]MCC2617156.1 tRNA glutamyl-Q(34) synthetase GluQRS [Aestuariibacter halophilus]
MNTPDKRSDLSSDATYCGRFAPSPSGPLHLGSLLTAVASYLQAKVNHGQWRLRIDDIDPPREVPGAAQQIQRTLDAHGLHWDGDIVWQSQRHDAYHEALLQLRQQQLTYGCECTRKALRQRQPDMLYDGFCRQRGLPFDDNAERFRQQGDTAVMVDALHGTLLCDDAHSREDFVLRRKDGLYAYHLASVVDDAYMGVSEIVRGSDLLQPSQSQMALFQALNVSAPTTLHLPVLVSRPGFKLSKQNHAAGIDDHRASENLTQVLTLLGHPPPDGLHTASPSTILDWATAHWDLQQIPAQSELQAP